MDFKNSKVLQKIYDIQQKKLIVKKTKLNTFLKGASGKGTKYAGLDDVWEVLEPVLVESKLMCKHNVVDGTVYTHIIDMESGEEEVTGLKIDSLEPQRMGAAITYFKRYNLGCIFNIMTDEDTDGNTNTSARGKNGDSSGEKLIQGANVLRVKEMLKTGYNCTTAEQASKKLSELVGREINIKKYTEEEAKKDLLILFKKD